MSAQVRYLATLESTGPCPSCGVEFAIPQNLLSALRSNKRNFCCPNGHSQSFIESEAEQLKKQLAEKERLLVEKESSLLYQRGRAEKAEAAHASAQSKLKRVKHGVCPCCKRTVSQLARHMKSKHPEFKP